MTIFLLSILIAGSLLYFKKAKNDRDWRPEHSKLASAKIDGDAIFIKNIRNCTYKSENDFKLDYYDKKFDLGKIKSLDFVVQPFKKKPLIGHVFLSFGFENGSYLSVSVESRRKRNKKYSLFWGFFRQYELIYILADEGDILRLRPLHQKDKVYVYPLNIKKEKIKKIFLDIIKRVNRIEGKPEFYNTLTNSCVTNIFKHIKADGEMKIPKSWKFLFPATLDKFMYDANMIKTNLSFENLRENHLINEKAEKYKNESDYSAKIRS